MMYVKIILDPVIDTSSVCMESMLRPSNLGLRANHGRAINLTRLNLGLEHSLFTRLIRVAYRTPFRRQRSFSTHPSVTPMAVRYAADEPSDLDDDIR